MSSGHENTVELPELQEKGMFSIRGQLDGELSEDFVEREQHIGLFVGKEEFLMPIAAIEEIIMLPPITYVPQGPKYVDGVINLRGVILAAINMRRVMGLSKGGPSSASRVIIVREGDHRFGLIVDGISFVVAPLPQEIEPTKLTSKRSGTELICGICKHNNKITGVLSLQKILSVAAGGKLNIEDPEDSDEELHSA
jgi:purine-binding chemotaxis protein CheW